MSGSTPPLIRALWCGLYFLCYKFPWPIEGEDDI